MSAELDELATKTQAEEPAASAPTEVKVNVSANAPEKNDKEKEVEKEPKTASLEVVIFDLKHHAIPNLALRVIDKRQTNPRKQVLFEGSTDAAGKIPLIENLPVGTNFEVQIKRDNGDYKLSSIGTLTVAEEHTANIQIPRYRFEFTTFSHAGPAGQAEQKVKALVAKHSQTPEESPNISRNPPDKKPEVQQERNKDGNPVAVITLGLKNMLGQNALATAPPTAGRSDLEKVKALIDFATEQATWKHPENKTSASIIGEMKQGTYQKEGTKDDTESAHRCTKYVKIALWKAGYSHNNGDIAPLVSPAREMGPALEAAGFANITKQIPDGRWAAPGDVIVYKDKRGDARAGHIDIRTYDGYISDFIGKRLPTSGFEVIGIYRKFYDPLPEQRMRAFLKVLREWECHEEKDDAKRYFMLGIGLKINGNRTFTDTTKHPFEDTEITKNNPAGAYQILLSTYKGYVAPKTDIQRGFSPVIQDRIVISMLESIPKYKFGDVLANIRKGEITEAVNKLGKTWTSLPSGDQPRRGKRGTSIYTYQIYDLLNSYNDFLKDVDAK